MKKEPIEGSETSAIRTKTPGNCPKENILQLLHIIVIIIIIICFALYAGHLQFYTRKNPCFYGI